MESVDEASAVKLEKLWCTVYRKPFAAFRFRTVYSGTRKRRMTEADKIREAAQLRAAAIDQGEQPQEWLDAVPGPDSIVAMAQQGVGANKLREAITKTDDSRGGPRFSERYPLTWKALQKAVQ